MDEYISREELHKQIASAYITAERYGFDLGKDVILLAIKQQPAADVKPVIHAHWYVDDGCAYCSNCRNNFKKAILKEAKYCPKCGAQIDGYGGHPDAGPPTPYDLLYEEGGATTT